MLLGRPLSTSLINNLHTHGRPLHVELIFLPLDNIMDKLEMVRFFCSLSNTIVVFIFFKISIEFCEGEHRSHPFFLVFFWGGGGGGVEGNRFSCESKPG